MAKDSDDRSFWEMFYKPKKDYLQRLLGFSEKPLGGFAFRGILHLIEHTRGLMVLCSLLEYALYFEFLTETQERYRAKVLIWNDLTGTMLGSNVVYLFDDKYLPEEDILDELLEGGYLFRLDSTMVTRYFIPYIIPCDFSYLSKEARDALNTIRYNWRNR